MKKLVLVILDGWGVNKNKKGNAILLAKTPNFDYLKKNFPYTELKASGEAVGLMKGMIGNSETGHLNIGAGRIVIQDIIRINRSIKDGSFFKNKALLRAIKTAKRNNSTLHLMGLLSDAGVHSYSHHLFALIKLASQYKLKKVAIHIFADGRDAGIKSIQKYISRLNNQIEKYKTGEIATITGRYYAMDRDQRWDRTKKAYRAIAQAKGLKVKTVLDGIKIAYEKGETDEFIKPLIIKDYKGIKNGDSVIFFNFRSDRPRQLTKAFVEKNFNKFERKKLKLTFVCFKEYYKKMNALWAFEKKEMKNVLGEVISQNKIKQLRIAETEKYAHVTFFFNALIEKPFWGEERIIVPSPKIATYDLRPEMSALKVKNIILGKINSERYGLIILNFANTDMVGHTGKLKSAIKAVEIIDKYLGEIIELIIKKGNIAVVTADHGNVEEMINLKTGGPLSSHSTNLVPFIIVSDKKYFLKKGKLGDIAPTILELMEIKKPKEMTGDSLIK